MKILSFDCATKSLAYILFDINFDINTINDNLKNILYYIKKKSYEKALSNIKKINEYMYIKVIKYGALDLFPGESDKSISSVRRIIRLCEILDNEKILDENFDHIIVENQMGINTHSKQIADALITYFRKFNICLINPSIKNTMIVDGITLSNFRGKSKYLRNKKHAVMCVRKLSNIFNINLLCEKKFEKDLSDAFLQAIAAYCKKYI